MATIFDRLQNLWNTAKSSQAKTRAAFTIKDPNGQPFQATTHYFQVLINEMYLDTQREWWQTYSPLVLVVSNYLYGTAIETVPTVVGPDLFKQYQNDLTNNFIVRNAPVTSMHPYQGGAVTITMFLNKIKQENNAEKVLSVLESIAGIINPITPAIPFTSYLKIAGSVMDGVESLLGMKETSSVLAYRFTVNPQLVSQLFEPCYVVLIDQDQAATNPAEFFIKEGRLFNGPNLDAAKPYNGADFILLQIAQGLQRNDERTLDFYPLYQETRDLAAQSSNDHFWLEAKAHFNTLKRSMLNNPDLVKPDFDRLLNQYLQEIINQRQQSAALANLGSATSLGPSEQQMISISKKLDALDEL